MGFVLQVIRQPGLKHFVVIPSSMGKTDSDREEVKSLLIQHGIMPHDCYPATRMDAQGVDWVMIKLKRPLPLTQFELRYLYQAKVRGDTVLQV